MTAVQEQPAEAQTNSVNKVNSSTTVLHLCHWATLSAHDPDPARDQETLPAISPPKMTLLVLCLRPTAKKNHLVPDYAKKSNG